MHKNKLLKVIELFAGVGDFRLGLEKNVKNSACKAYGVISGKWVQRNKSTQTNQHRAMIIDNEKKNVFKIWINSQIFVNNRIFKNKAILMV